MKPIFFPKNSKMFFFSDKTSFPIKNENWVFLLKHKIEFFRQIQVFWLKRIFHECWMRELEGEFEKRDDSESVAPRYDLILSNIFVMKITWRVNYKMLQMYTVNATL